MKTFAKISLFVVFLTFAFCAGFAWNDLRLGNAPSGEAFSRLLSGKLDDGPTPTQLFRANYNLILARFHRPIAPDKLRNAGLEGLFAALGDPHTLFMEPQTAENFSIETRGNYAGIGARLGADPLGGSVGTVFKNGPAEKAGLKVGDLITRVGNIDIAGMAVEEIVTYIRGEEGTSVTLTVMRAGTSDPIKIKVDRAVVVVPTAEGMMIDGTKVGYIKVDQFAETTVQQFDTALFDVLRSEPEGLVIDMRGNPGGLLDTAVLMLSRFIENKTVVTMRERGGRREESRTLTGRKADFAGPIVVLVDNGSASASEIFAGVLRDYKRATLVGQHTYGKSTVQTAILLKDMSTAKITTARYYLPSGENFSRVVDEDGTYIRGGIKPEVEVKLDPTVPWEQGVPAKDAQLAEAIRLVNKKLGR